jgi:hypothetical protein
MRARNRTSKPDTRHDLPRATVYHERAPCRLIPGAAGDHRVVLLAIRPRSAEKDAGAHVSSCQGARIPAGERLSEGDEAAGMIPMVMAQHQVGDVGQIDAQLAGIVEHGLGAGPGIEQETTTVGLDQGREAPLADPRHIREHGREHRDPHGPDLMRGGAGRIDSESRGMPGRGGHHPQQRERVQDAHRRSSSGAERKLPRRTRLVQSLTNYLSD